MGYTHYIRQSRNLTDEEWAKLKIGAEKIVKKYSDILTGWNGIEDTEIELDENTFAFNGIENDAHETCRINRVMKNDFNFCKTARKPYDEAVVETYKLAKKVAPDAFKLSSDGGSKIFG